MTLVLGVRCRDGFVLAADSQRTQGAMRERVQKLFTSPTGILWGAAGSIAIQQELDAEIRDLTIGLHPEARVAKRAIVAAIRAAKDRAIEAVEDPPDAVQAIQGLFAWYSKAEHAHYLLRVANAGHAEFHADYTAIGNGADLARFALGRSDYLGLSGLALDPAQMIAFEAADDVIRATATGLGAPVQIGVVTDSRCVVLPSEERQALEDTVSVWRERKRSMLAPPGSPSVLPGDTGIRP